MDYSRIRVLMMQQNFSERGFAKSIGMSSSGFRAAMDKHTLSVAAIEKIAEILGVSVTSFFNNDELLGANEPAGNYNRKCSNCVKKEGMIELLTKQLQEKDQQIAALNKELGRKLGRENTSVA